LAWSWAGPASLAAQSDRDFGCHEWHQCRAMAEAAAERGEYETFHDLAWRAVQTGPPRDPALMYFLARAQVLSGRPHDALVMLDRLAQMGVPSDADTNDDFIRTRQLPGWPEVAARIERLRGATSPAAPAAPAASARASAPESEAARFSISRLAVVGLAYDAVSRRVLVGDRLGRKLVSVREGANHGDDLVRADSAGFHDISAIDIDDKRGDLWVTSGSDADGAGTLHRLQLVSGRPLKAFRVAPAGRPVDLVDLTITPGGTIVVLDAASGRILGLRPRAASVETIARIDVTAPVSVAASTDEAIVYVAHSNGVSRFDMRTHTATPVAVPKGISLARLQQIRWYRNSLIAVAAEQGSNRIVRFDLNSGGRAVTRATTLEASAAVAGRACMTVSGDDLLYLAPDAVHEGGSDSSDGRVATALVAYRVHLR
jgi:hypothetical protein